jgi:hypothetical protein
MAICPFLTNHVVSGSTGSEFTSICTPEYDINLFTRACYFSEEVNIEGYDPEDEEYQPNQ